MKKLISFFICIIALPFSATAQTAEAVKFLEIVTEKGTLTITPVVHGSLMVEFDGKVVHVDPYSRGDYSDKPKADLILLTHHHRDHLDSGLVEKLKKEGTIIVGTAECAKMLSGIKTLANGETGTFLGIPVKAVPAYNLVRERSPGVKYHPKGVGNGYVIDFGGKKVYIAGDTENVPEMKDLGEIEVAFLPCNLPYTMTPENLANAADMIRPKILFAYHLGQTDIEAIRKALIGKTFLKLLYAK